MNDLGKAFSFPFKDPAWFSKSVIAVVFMFLCIFVVGFFVLAGYFVQVTQKVMRREPNPLPDWTDIGVKFVVGFKLAVVYLVYLLPIILLYVPFAVLAVVGAISGNDELSGIFAGIYMLGLVFLVIIPYSLAFAMLTPIIAYRFAANERIGEALDIGEIFRIFKKNWQSTVIVALVQIGVESFAGIGIIAFFIGIFFTIFYLYLVSAYLHGALYLEHSAAGATA
jgi:hypothetical protein